MRNLHRGAISIYSVVKKLVSLLGVGIIVCTSLMAQTQDIVIQDDFSFTEQQINELNHLIKQCGKGVSVFFKDINAGYTYTYNSEEKYFIASVIKAPYCMYLFDLASQGKCDLNKRYTYEAHHQSGGTGKIQYMSVGTRFTLEELLEYAIKYSDNVAMSILKENFPVEGYKAYVKNLGLKYPEDIKNATNGNITAEDAGIYCEAIYKFITSNPNGDKLRTLMLSTTNPMIVSTYPVVRKYGWAEDSFHDMAIIEAPNSYLLCILTNHDGDFSTFKKISQIIENYSQINRKPSIKVEAISTTTVVSEKMFPLEGYNIEDQNYYKLRDVAKVLNGTQKQFDIAYNAQNGSTQLLLNETYTEEENSTGIKNKNDTRMRIEEKEMTLMIDHGTYQVQAYRINDNYYMKIRDVAELVNFQVGWSNTDKQMSLIV